MNVFTKYNPPSGSKKLPGTRGFKSSRFFQTMPRKTCAARMGGRAPFAQRDFPFRRKMADFRAGMFPARIDSQSMGSMSVLSRDKEQVTNQTQEEIR